MARIVTLNAWGNEALTGWRELSEIVKIYRALMYERVIIIEQL